MQVLIFGVKFVRGNVALVFWARERPLAGPGRRVWVEVCGIYPGAFLGGVVGACGGVVDFLVVGGVKFWDPGRDPATP